MFCWKTFGWACLVVFVLFLLLSFPVLFNFFAIHFWHVPESELSDYTKLGPIGDIYGSLNTIFTSATLAFVVYATLLQRQANQDARDAMEKQLQQAREDTEKQLEQAREATQQQIEHAKQLADIQLKQSMDVSSKQLELAQATNDAQINESRYAIFTNVFEMLMSQKLTLQKDLCSHLENSKTPQVIFQKMAQEFEFLLNNAWQNIEKINISDVDEEFNRAANQIEDSVFFSDILYNYFYVYDSLLFLVKSSQIDKSQKKIFYKLISNSMDINEQLTLIWFSAFTDRVRSNLINSRIFDFDFDPIFLPFSLKFHRRTHFNSVAYDMAFKKLMINQTPT